MLLYAYKQYKFLEGLLQSALGSPCCFSCLGGMAFINMERVLDFHLVLIHVTEVGRAIPTGTPEAVNPK